MAVYTCGKCGFIFERAGLVDTCPDCGHSYIRASTKDEIAEYKKNRAEFSNDDAKENLT